MNNEEKFVKMMGENINGWMSSYYNALPFVAELVMDGKIDLNPKTDLDQLSNDLAEKYLAFDSDTFSTVLSCFSSLSQPLTFDVLDNYHQFDDYGLKTAEEKAKAIQGTMESDSIKAVALN